MLAPITKGCECCGGRLRVWTKKIGEQAGDCRSSELRPYSKKIGLWRTCFGGPRKKKTVLLKNYIKELPKKGGGLEVNPIFLETGKPIL